MAHAYSVCSICCLGYDGCKQCHTHIIKCKRNTLTYHTVYTQASSTGQGRHHKTDTPVPAYIVQVVLKRKHQHSLDHVMLWQLWQTYQHHPQTLDRFFLLFFSVSISVVLISGISLVDYLRQLEPKFMGPVKASIIVQSHHEDDSVPVLQDMMNPPVKCWFVLKALWQPGLGVSP